MPCKPDGCVQFPDPTCRYKETQIHRVVLRPPQVGDNAHSCLHKMFTHAHEHTPRVILNKLKSFFTWQARWGWGGRNAKYSGGFITKSNRNPAVRWLGWWPPSQGQLCPSPLPTGSVPLLLCIVRSPDALFTEVY